MPRIRSYLAAPLLLATLALAGCSDGLLTGSDARAARAITPERHPILFVHGWNGSASTWSTMISRFKADGWTDAQLNAFTYNSSQSNATTAADIQSRVNAILAATGATKVDIVSHSMGGLSSRYYAKNLGGDTRIDAWISLGGPNHGTSFANACFSTSCVEMRIGSSFLTALNSGDETPGAPRYATWWSPCDDIINPDDSVLLAGATNNKTACVSHTALPTDLAVYQAVRAFVHQ